MNVRARCEDPASSYNFGWSHGKEALVGGRPDVHKGSYYANPVHDEVTADEDLMRQYPSYCRCSGVFRSKPVPKSGVRVTAGHEQGQQPCTWADCVFWGGAVWVVVMVMRLLRMDWQYEPVRSTTSVVLHHFSFTAWRSARC